MKRRRAVRIAPHGNPVFLRVEMDRVQHFSRTGVLEEDRFTVGGKGKTELVLIE